MKKNMAPFVVLGAFFMQIQAAEYPSFELWNKTSKPIWFATASTKEMSDDKIMSEPLAELPAGKYAITKRGLIDKSNFTHLLITQNPDEKSATVYTFNPDKYIWVRVKEEKGKLIFGPQTGPLRGLLDTTEHGYPLDKNVKPSDYKVEKRTRSKEQEGMMIAKSGLRRSPRYIISP